MSPGGVARREVEQAPAVGPRDVAFGDVLAEGCAAAADESEYFAVFGIGGYRAVTRWRNRFFGNYFRPP